MSQIHTVISNMPYLQKRRCPRRVSQPLRYSFSLPKASIVVSRPPAITSTALCIFSADLRAGYCLWDSPSLFSPRLCLHKPVSSKSAPTTSLLRLLLRRGRMQIFRLDRLLLVRSVRSNQIHQTLLLHSLRFRFRRLFCLLTQRIFRLLSLQLN